MGNTPFFGEGFENVAKQMNQQPQAPMKPPALSLEEATVQQIQARQQQRAADVDLQMQNLDQADKFEQNAQVAEQAAQDSRMAADEIRQDVQQLETINQQEEAQESQALDEVENLKIAETFQANSEEVRQNIAKSIGLSPDTLDEEVLDTYRNLESIVAGQVDANNAKQVELKRKIDSGQELAGKDKLALGLAAILPIIVGAAKGKPAQGVAAAMQTFGAFQKAREDGRRKLADELDAARKEELGLVEMSAKLLDRKVGTLSKTEQKKLNRAESIEKQIGQRLRNKGLTYQTASDKEDLKQRLVKTQQLLDKAEKGAIDKDITEKQALAARFAIQTSQAEEQFKSGFIPKPGELSLPNAVQSKETQQFKQAALQFVNATLRPESGAAISFEELTKGELQYVPLFGDDAETLERKRKARLAVSAGNFALAGENAIKKVQDQMDRLDTESQPSSGLTPEELKELEQLEKEGF